jgi:uncharacterized membrane protein YkgB
MSRISGGNPQIREVKPTSNVYTVLAAVGMVVVIAGLVVLFRQATLLFGPNGLMPQ